MSVAYILLFVSEGGAWVDVRTPVRISNTIERTDLYGGTEHKAHPTSTLY